MFEYQVWYKDPDREEVFYKVLKAESKGEVREKVLKEVPNAKIGVIALIDEEIKLESSDFFEALSELSNAANNLAFAVNRVIQTWPAENDVPRDVKDVIKELKEWEGKQSSPEVKWENLPLTLTVKEVAEILRIGTTHVYEFCKGSMYNFPVIQVGKRFVIPRDKLREWIDKQHS